MKISDVVYTTVDEMNAMPRFDLLEPPRKAKWYLQIVAWMLSFPETIATRAKVTKINMKGLKPPYVLLCNHNSFLDFKVATKAVFPHRSNYIVAIDGFINREELLRNVGCFGKRKFVTDSTMFRQIKHSLNVNRSICQIYAEARYSLVGTTAILPDSLGKLCKKLGHPVVTLISHGHHLRQPVWNLNKRKLHTTSDITQIITKDEIQTLSVDEINQRIRTHFQYDDYQYQRDHKIRITYPNRAKGLHKILYQCPSCKTEFKMTSKANQLICEACGEVHNMDEYGVLHNTSGNTTFSHIPDWYEWIRSQVREEILRDEYHVDMDVQVDILPNSTGFYRLGKGHITHNADGFHLTGHWDHGDLDIQKPVSANYSLHLEFDYFGKGDGFSFSNINDTFYLYPIDQSFAVTKLHFAVEELFKLNQ
ncbi:hypothetical protein [Candidatus Xianfuyuplasma coldseepsis]|uniref:Phospholipid/glycerol acyltransferase domain-containing protein n=1 Tax=Candidatus Xianfuyuplasma coldseepsis TaxID=2782163 RepID=A0A7L7KSV7_9MOLU|nr:hypothetical protein [Xianfuyuplasma coldseepsis]QMS84858.1 hypothetical protein G4Z02_03515 [Xianfuyuplasma coldseepsis]